MVAGQREKRRTTRQQKEYVEWLEEKFRMPITYLIVKEINERGFVGAAATLKISEPLLNSWVRNLGIRVQRVVVGPGDEILVTRRTEY